MAAPLMKAVRRSVLYVRTPLFQQVCGKKFKLGKSSRNQQDHAPGKHRGPKKQDGEIVYKGEVVLKQFRLKIYPGENVGILRDNTLFALCDGQVVVTCEKLNPYPDSPLYNKVQNGVQIYKKFWNIYPTPIRAKFKLISETCPTL